MKPVAKGGAAATRLTMIAALLLGAAAPALADETIAYTYDTLGRLVKVARSGTANAGKNECYSYDQASNRSNVTVVTSGDCATGGGGTGGVSFSIASNGPVTEGTLSKFTVTKTGTASGSLTVSYATANGTAVAPGDYTAKTLTGLTFTTNQTSKTVNVTTIDDTTAESDETFSMSLSAPTGGATIGTGTAVATINDNDGGGGGSTCTGVSFSVASNGAVTEGANSVFTITKSGSTSSSCTVNYATANVTALAGSDYTTKTGTLTFTSVQTSQTVNVTTIDDTAVESPETFTLSLSAPSGGSTIGTGTATATINDNDSGGGSNNPPVAVNDSGYTQATCSTDYYAVLANDSDPDGDPLTLVSATGGTFSVSGSLIQFNSLAGTGLKTSTYTISDGRGGSASATLSVTVYDDGSCTNLVTPGPEETDSSVTDPPVEQPTADEPAPPPGAGS